MPITVHMRLSFTALNIECAGQVLEKGAGSCLGWLA